MASFESRRLVIDTVTQARNIALCGIDPSIFNGHVDPTAFTALGIQEAQRNGFDLPTGVHSGQSLKLHRTINLGEPLTLEGAMTDRVKVDRGESVSFVVQLHDEAGRLVVESSENLLILDPEAPKPAKSQAAPSAAVREDHGEVVFRPDQVAAYCEGREVDPMHYDPEAAARLGFRAPIIGGEQGVRHLMALLWKSLSPASLSIGLRFLRPIFWDDRCTMSIERSGRQWTGITLLKDGKPASELSIKELVPHGKLETSS